MLDAQNSAKPASDNKQKASKSGARHHINRASRALNDAIVRVEEFEIQLEVTMCVFALRYEKGKTIPSIVYSLKRWRTMKDKDGKERPDTRFWRTEKQIRRILEHPGLVLPSDGL